MRFLVVTVLAVSACASMAPLPQPTGPCAITDAVRMRYIGVRYRELMRTVMEMDANARVSRILRPDVPGSSDERNDRLDILLDDHDQIDGLRCS